jgi:hypothetical protein
MRVSFRWALALGLALGVPVGLGSGCSNQADQIPLADVKTPPPLPPQEKQDIKAPAGSSPSVLPSGPSGPPTP